MYAIKSQVLTFNMWISCIVGLLSGVILIPITSDQSLQVIVLTIVVIISIMYIWYLHIKLHNTKLKLHNAKPNIKCLMPVFSLFLYKEGSSSLKAIIKYTELISNLSFVTLYLIENDIEYYFATAKVINVQVEDDLAQVEIIHFNSEYSESELRDKEIAMKNNDITLIESIIIKLSLGDEFTKTLNLGGFYIE